jgi:hypothetical protein
MVENMEESKIRMLLNQEYKNKDSTRQSKRIKEKDKMVLRKSAKSIYDPTIRDKKRLCLLQNRYSLLYLIVDD